MSFVKADSEKEKEQLEQLIKSDNEANRAYEEFCARISLQEKLVSKRKAEHLTQKEVAAASGMSQQAVSRIEKGSGATINSLIKYLLSIGYTIELKKQP